jgi:hypothetical protein
MLTDHVQIWVWSSKYKVLFIKLVIVWDVIKFCKRTTHLQPFWKVLQEASSRGRSVIGEIHMLLCCNTVTWLLCFCLGWHISWFRCTRGKFYWASTWQARFWEDSTIHSARNKTKTNYRWLLVSAFEGLV